MKETCAWVVACVAAVGVSALAAQSQPTQTAPDPAGGKTVTLQGCVEPRIGKAEGAGPSTPVVPGGAGTTSATGSAADPVSGAQGTPSQAGRPMPEQPASAGNYVLRVAESASSGPRTGMPSSTSGQTDERSAAGQAGGKVYQLIASAGTNLAPHVGHRIEVSGTMPGASTRADQVTDSGVIKVARIKMIAATCK